MLRDLACPTCGAPGLEAQQPDGLVLCRFCGSKFAEDNRIACPRCEAINSPEVSYCAKCGDKLKRPCPACGAENWAGADYCARCGHDLDVIESLARRHAQGFKGTLQKQRDGAKPLKDLEETASQNRLAGMWEVERKRQAALAQQHARQQSQQTRLLLVTIVVGVLVLAGLAVGAITMLR